MVVIIPISIHAPAVIVLIPPPMVLDPAALARFSKLVPPMFSLLAVTAVMLDGFMQLVIDFGDMMLAIIIVGSKVRSGHKYQQANRCC